MAQASHQSADSRPRREGYRLHASTYVAGAFVAAALALAIVPGQVTDHGTAVEHGWPWIFLKQTNWAAGILGPKFSAWHLLQFSEDASDTPVAKADFRPHVLALDLVSALLLLIPCVAAFECSRRRRNCAIQFSLRSLMACVLFAACACGWLLHLDRQVRQEEAAGQALRKLGAEVSTRPLLPTWLLEICPCDATQRFCRVTRVNLFPGSISCGAFKFNERNAAIDDAAIAPLAELTCMVELNLDGVRLTDCSMEKISRLRKLEDLSLNSTKITDAGLAQLSHLGSLKTLSLCNTAITDAGLVHLAEIRSLKYVFLDGTQVTPEGMRKLKQALPSLKTTNFGDQLDLQDFSPF